MGYFDPIDARSISSPLEVIHIPADSIQRPRLVLYLDDMKPIRGYLEGRLRRIGQEREVALLSPG